MLLWCLLVAAASRGCAQVAVTTLAGSGAAAFAEGSGTAASFAGPSGVAIDASGNVIVADTGSNRIRKVTPQGVVTTLAGNGSAMFADGASSNSSFNGPCGVAVDASGNVIVADTGSNRIRKVTPQGVVTTLAGNGSAMFADGASSAFNGHFGVAVDASGNVIVADTGSNRIRKVTPKGVVSTLAGNGSASFASGIGSSATFNGPTGVAIDAGGNIIIADSSNNRIRKLTPGGTVSTLAGSGTAASADGAAFFSNPYGVAVSTTGCVIVADSSNHKIRLIYPNLTAITLVGGGSSGAISGSTNGVGTAALFLSPFGVAVDASGNVLVAELGNKRIRKLVCAAGSFSANGVSACASCDAVRRMHAPAR